MGSVCDTSRSSSGQGASDLSHPAIEGQGMRPGRHPGRPWPHRLAQLAVICFHSSHSTGNGQGRVVHHCRFDVFDGRRSPGEHPHERSRGSSAQGVLATLSGLRPNTRYHFRALAQSAAGITTGGDVSFRTSAPRVQGGARPGPDRPHERSRHGARPRPLPRGDLRTLHGPPRARAARPRHGRRA